VGELQFQPAFAKLLNEMMSFCFAQAQDSKSNKHLNFVRLLGDHFDFASHDLAKEVVRFTSGRINAFNNPTEIDAFHAEAHALHVVARGLRNSPGLVPTDEANALLYQLLTNATAAPEEEEKSIRLLPSRFRVEMEDAFLKEHVKGLADRRFFIWDESELPKLVASFARLTDRSPARMEWAARHLMEVQTGGMDRHVRAWKCLEAAALAASDIQGARRQQIDSEIAGKLLAVGVNVPHDRLGGSPSDAQGSPVVDCHLKAVEIDPRVAPRAFAGLLKRFEGPDAKHLNDHLKNWIAILSMQADFGEVGRTSMDHPDGGKVEYPQWLVERREKLQNRWPQAAQERANVGISPNVTIHLAPTSQVPKVTSRDWMDMLHILQRH
jgi:hypothetical protein